MSDLHKPCYNATSNFPCYKYGGSLPVYKVAAGGLTEISFAWGSDGNDLDICAYWDGTDMKFGYDYNTGTSEYVYPDADKGPYHVLYSGDIRSAGQTEWLKLKNTPWSLGAGTFKVHFNFYGHSSSYPASTCKVIASQQGGRTIIKDAQNCSTSSGRAANENDPYCVIVFDEHGNLTEVR